MDPIHVLAIDKPSYEEIERYFAERHQRSLHRRLRWRLSVPRLTPRRRREWIAPAATA